MENTSVNSNNDILTIKKLSKIYHTNKSEIPAIKDLNLNIKDGEFVAIVGPSGCGKTTLLSILCGLENKSSGNILFPKGKAKMGYMLQNDTLFPWLNILDNSLLGLKVQKKITKENKDKVYNVNIDADISYVDEDGNTPLLVACANDLPFLVSLLYYNKKVHLLKHRWTYNI